MREDSKVNDHILSISYGKDSLACLGAIDMLKWPLDRIVHAEVWATDTIPADLPPMMDFKRKVDYVIKNRWGIEVEHYRAKQTFHSRFYKLRTGKNPKYTGMYTGWPSKCRNWCNGELKISALKAAQKDAQTIYIGIAADETKRLGRINGKKKSPLLAANWTESMCKDWCKKNGLLSPMYDTTTRGGCWFCYNQRVDDLRKLRREYPELWKLMLKWDDDSPTTFNLNGRTVHDYALRFRLEDDGIVPLNNSFRWANVLEYKQIPGQITMEDIML